MAEEELTMEDLMLRYTEDQCRIKEFQDTIASNNTLVAQLSSSIRTIQADKATLNTNYQMLLAAIASGAVVACALFMLYSEPEINPVREVSFKAPSTQEIYKIKDSENAR